MSFELARRELSPAASSGRASPVARPPRRQVEDEPRRQDKTYRRYAAGIERALASFDSAHLEWPDYISFLGRLLKAIQVHPPTIDNIPHRATVANRLAQCLNPSLPSGVHQKAIEVYGYIFSVIGKDALALDLAVYLPGLAPVLTFASLSLRPLFLSLIETYILELPGGALRPALKALLLCVLPGLEEENSDEFERTLQIVEALKDAVDLASRKGTHRAHISGEEYFWQCIFLASISSASRRQGALAFLAKSLPKLGGREKDGSGTADGENISTAAGALSNAAAAVISPEPGLLIRCFAAGLGDDQVLLQRGYLDLLLTHLPLNSPVLTQRVSGDDLEQLVGAAVGVVARRDMSLNRRLWSWFLGPHTNDETGEKQEIPGSASGDGALETQTDGRGASAYFNQFGKRPLTNSLLKLIDQRPSIISDRARPFRICLSLMDRAEIGTLIVPMVFLPAMESLLTFQKYAKEEDFQEVLRSASSFFDGVESGIIWGQMLELISSSLGPGRLDDRERRERLQVARFITDHFNVREEEMLTVHVPLVASYAFAAINQRESSEDATINSLQSEPLHDLGTSLLEKLIEMMPERAELNSSFGKEVLEHDATAENGRRHELMEHIQEFYQSDNGNMTMSPPPFSSRHTGDLLLQEASDLLRIALVHNLSSDTTIIRARLLSALIAKLPDCEPKALPGLTESFHLALQRSRSSRAGVSRTPFGTLTAITHVLTQLASTHAESSELQPTNRSRIIAALVKGFWSYLSPSFPKYHVEAVRCLWQLDELWPAGHVVESSLADFLASLDHPQAEDSPELEPARRFTVLWTHTTHSSSSQAKRANSVWSKHGANASDPLSQHDSKSYEAELHRPLLLLLDSSRDVESALGYFIREWLQTLPNLRLVFGFLLDAIIATQSSGYGTNIEADDAQVQCDHQDTRSECLYYLQLMSSLLNLHSEHMWATLLEAPGSIPSFAGFRPESKNLLESVAQACLNVVQELAQLPTSSKAEVDVSLQRAALVDLQLLMRSPDPSSLQKLHLDEALIEILMQTVQSGVENFSIQVSLLDTVTAALELQLSTPIARERPHSYRSASSMDAAKTLSKTSLIADGDGMSKDLASRKHSPPPPQLVKCLQAGVSSSTSLHALENWMKFLNDVLPLYAETLFQNMIPLVECFCSRIRSMFQQLNNLFKNATTESTIAPEPALVSLLNGLEYILATAHERMAAEESKKAATRSPEPAQGFFGNVVSGVFSSDAQKGRSSVANTRLTVILCFQDTIRICLPIWSWGGYGQGADEQDATCAASFGYVSQRLRNRARRILDRVFMAEPLECLETLIVAWAHQGALILQPRTSSVVSLLHVLDSSRPKHTMPAIFNAIYSRTNPAAIDASRMSSLTSDITDLELGQFVVEYTQSLDDDAMDEIWIDCMTFLRDVLMNPLPHHNILPSLLLFLVTLAEKVENTNFGEQRKMRRELSDLFLRLLTAIFTTRSAGTLQEPAQAIFAGEKVVNGDMSAGRPARRKAGYYDLVDTLNATLPRLSGVFSDNDRLISAVSNISTNLIAPMLHSKAFPENCRSNLLTLWVNLTKITPASKIWKKDIADAMNHSKFFSTKLDMVRGGWMPLLRQWVMSDKDRIPELCARISPPTSAGNIFGVGASAARLEADKKTQLNLRRIAILVLAAESDLFMTSLGLLEEKTTELLNATAASSPSSATRAELFILIRALLLRTSFIHLAPLWPILTSELQRALTSALPRSKDYDVYNVPSLLQACKLLDLLLVLAPDDFQMHEWLFITDTIEAVYRPGHWDPTALVDDLAEELGSNSTLLSPEPTTPAGEFPTIRSGSQKVPLLNVMHGLSECGKEEFVSKVLQPFFSQLSIHAYESTYSMTGVDWEACEDALLKDLFDDSTIVG